MWNDTHIGFHVCLPCALPLPLSSLPSILHPSVHPSLHSGASITPSFSVWLRPTASSPPSSSAPLTRRPPAPGRPPGLTKSIEAEIARSVVVADDDVVCLCYVTMRMIPLQPRRRLRRPLAAGPVDDYMQDMRRLPLRAARTTHPLTVT